MQRKVTVLGMISNVGGAGTELEHTIKLWRHYGLDVHVIPTWDAPTTADRQHVESLGATVHLLKPPQVAAFDFGSGPAVGFCNPKFLNAVQWLRKAGAPLVWCNCMTQLHKDEGRTWKQFGLPDAFMFQSQYQMQAIAPSLHRFGYTDDDERGYLVRGAFWLADGGWEWQFQSREPNSPFVVGKLARAARMKWWSSMYDHLAKVPNIQGLFMGVDDAIKRRLGQRPKWAKPLPPGHIPTIDFYRQLHALVNVNGGDRENWPRVGLEAMALGVPVVAERRWGWLEMIEHEYTGLLCTNYRDVVAALCRLERDEGLRLELAKNAREALETHLARPDLIWRQWCELWHGIGCGHLAEVSAVEIAALPLVNADETLT